MSYINSIPSLDEFVLEDQIILLLKRSPQTQQFIYDRVSELVVQIITQPIVQQLNSRVNQLQSRVEELQKQNQALGTVHSRDKNKKMNRIEKLQQKQVHLQQQIEEFKNVEKENIQLKEQLKYFKLNVEVLAKEVEQMSKKIEKYQNQLNSKAGQLLVLTEQTQIWKKQFDKKNKNLKDVEDQLEKVKKLCKQTKYKQITYKKEGQRLSSQIEGDVLQIEKLKEELKSQKIKRDNERKALNSRMNDLHKYKRCTQKIKKKICAIYNENRQLKKVLGAFKQAYAKIMKSLIDEAIKNSYNLMDQIGEQVNRQLKELMGQIAKINIEVQIYKQQNKIKDEIIEKLEKVSSVQLMGNRELQKQLRSKKLEADSLRKQLKKNYEQSQIKLLGLEHNYRQVLANTLNYPR